MPEADVLNICGVNACLSVFARRPTDILRIYYHTARLRELSHVLKWAATQRLPYREVQLEELERLSQSTHHEGVVMSVRPQHVAAFDDTVLATAGRIVALDGVENPHNLGAIARSCAFFGVSTLLIGGMPAGQRVSAALLRASEGGAELIRLVGVRQLAPRLAELAKTRPVIGLETFGEQRFGRDPIAPDAVLVFGSESDGICEAVLDACTALAVLEGPGELQSLNVSVSVGIALALAEHSAKPVPRAPSGGRPLRRR